jgi:hypothetical protein
MEKGLTITCPHCRKSFTLDEGILQPIRADIQTSVEADYQAQMKKQVEAARADAAQKAAVITEQQTADLKKQADEANAAAQVAKKSEKAALEAQRKLAKDKEDLELVYLRKTQEETEKTRLDVRAKYDLELKAKDQTIDGFKKEIEELKRRADLGSQQAQGEALEITIKDRLIQAFPGDAIEDVPTGTRGADVIQKVNARFGRCCGTIMWESKQTKAWSNEWIAKLKKNQREAGAELAVIASTALPEGVSGFKEVEGVWVTGWPLAIQLASALRYALVELDRTKQAGEGKSHKMDLLYGYLVSPQFRQRIQDIVEAFSEMDDEIEKEKRAMTRIWAKREKLVDRVKNGTVTMYGELEGIMGSALPSLPALDMPLTLQEGGEDAEE